MGGCIIRVLSSWRADLDPDNFNETVTADTPGMRTGIRTAQDPLYPYASALQPQVIADTPENNRVWVVEFYSDRCPICKGAPLNTPWPHAVLRVSREQPLASTPTAAPICKGAPLNAPWPHAVLRVRREQPLASTPTAAPICKGARSCNLKCTGLAHNFPDDPAV
jgi:hypothetical protein